MTARRRRGAVALVALLAGLVGTPATAGPLDQLSTNDDFELFVEPTSDADRRAILRRAATLVGPLEIDLAGTPVTARTLAELADGHPDEPLLRATRELLRRPVDLDDFLLFLDDLLLARARGQRIATVTLPPGRARSAGILVHPYDVFRPERAVHYGAPERPLRLTAPVTQQGLRPARNGSPVGPRWAARYQQPKTERGRMRALRRANRDFARRVASLVKQLRDQGAWTHVESTVRPRRRGYLIYGSYWLGKADSARDVRRRVRTLNRLNRKWGLRVPIRWRHPKGWRRTVREAKRLAETYGVDYATRRGARKSDHYDGNAVDLWAVDLPRSLTLVAPDGAKRTFDLSDPAQPRDLSLTPALIEWVEAHFGVEKLTTDYPHWGDAKSTDG